MTRIRRLAALILLLMALPTAATSAATTPDTRPGSDVPAPTGYRMDRYRAPVPAEVPGATTATLDEAEALHRSGTVLFIDVMKVPRSESPGLENKWLVAKPHIAIKGSTWLPEVGEGTLKPEI